MPPVSRPRRFEDWLRGHWEAGARLQVTRAGLAFSLLIAMVGVAAFASANNLMFLLLAALISTFLVSGFVSRLGLAGLEMDLHLPEHITARRRVSGRLYVRNTKSWMPAFSIRLESTEGSRLESTLYFPVIPGGAAIEETVTAVFSRRGPHKENRFLFSTRFPFGFTERRALVTLAREVLVYPSIDPQDGFEDLLAAIEGEIEAHYRGRGHDFYRIRPYEALESARHVDWRATAHTGELQVREFAREQEHLVEILLDLDAPEAAREWFERAVECCAFLAWRVASRGARLRFATQKLDLRMPEEGDVYTILKYLALVEPARGRVAAVPHEESSFQVVFTHAGERLAQAGWHNARLLGPGDFPTGAKRPRSAAG